MLQADAVAELRTALLARRAEAEERLGAHARTFQDIVDAAANANVDDEHDPEGTTIAFERSQVDALAQSAHDALDEISAALARLDDGTYGVCEACGQPIPLDRLRARPTARRCVACA
ncbi:TraR/DksA family transcriptional regulator [Flavimobilis soli]|uniref:TraR/DksA family transcriptional regulator n=1 Tax=Flavimobilis soli TaxID=442709 RepID=A0A2A9ECQ6_9MICO|nr:TraR/DksA C4-type zinc finger protein [Flavimobilis soli]PFG36718.1 TraR/DksA family transcriptional regulator [Flavimobilis soli]